MDKALQILAALKQHNATIVPDGNTLKIGDWNFTASQDKMHINYKENKAITIDSKNTNSN